MQNKLMKLLLRLRRMTLTNELHMHLNKLKVSDIYKNIVLSFVNEILSGRSPDIFKNYFILKNNQYDMRRKGQLMFHHVEHKYVTKQSESLGPLSGIDWKNVCYSAVLKMY